MDNGKWEQGRNPSVSPLTSNNQCTYLIRKETIKVLSCKITHHIFHISKTCLKPRIQNVQINIYSSNLDVYNLILDLVLLSFVCHPS